MRRRINFSFNLIVIIYISLFIIFYFIFLINLYIIPNNRTIPFILLIGFTIIIVGFFYAFLKFSHHEKQKIVLRFRVLNENSIKLVLVILMLITIFIPPILSPKIIVDWHQIGFLNIFRAVVFLTIISFCLES